MRPSSRPSGTVRGWGSVFEELLPLGGRCHQALVVDAVGPQDLPWGGELPVEWSGGHGAASSSVYLSPCLKTSLRPSSLAPAPLLATLTQNLEGGECWESVSLTTLTRAHPAQTQAGSSEGMRSTLSKREAAGHGWGRPRGRRMWVDGSPGRPVVQRLKGAPTAAAIKSTRSPTSGPGALPCSLVSLHVL